MEESNFQTVELRAANIFAELLEEIFYASTDVLSQLESNKTIDREAITVVVKDIQKMSNIIC